MSQGQNFLPKFLFVSNLLKAMKIRERVPNDVVKPSATGGIIPHLRSMHRHTVEMIRMGHFPQAFREVVQTAVLDRAMQMSLEQEKRLNWCREVRKLVPLRTNGDGNCLLHAASQYMLGVQDTDLVLRKALYGALKETDTRNFRLRYQTELLQSQEFTQTGLRYNTLNWEEEWEKVVEMASPESSSQGLQYESLEDIHIFVLCNILRRPIIVIADQVLRSMKSGSSFSPLNVGGIYLPLHWPPGDCYKYPIVLGYDSQHFAPLITVQDSGPEIRAVPLCHQGRGVFEELKVHFLIEKEQLQKDKLLKEYLMLIEIPVNGFSQGTTHMINAARLDEGNLPEDMNLMEDYLQLVNHEYKCWQEDKEPAWEPRAQRAAPFSVSQLSLIEIRCATPRCTFYISVDTQPHCHECYEKRRAERNPEPRVLEAETKTRTTPPVAAAVATTSPRSAPPTAPSLSLYSETHAMKCKTPGCLFTLSVEHDGLCEHCHSALLQRGSWGAERCAACQQEAFRLFNGLCPPCLQRTVKERPEPQPQAPRAERSLAEWVPQSREVASAVPRLQRELPLVRMCKRSGCNFFGTPEQLGFCSICYEDYQINHRPGPAAAVVQRSPLPTRACVEPGVHNSSRCRRAGCGAAGRTSYEGYCKKCFVKEQDVRLCQASSRGAQSPPLAMRAAQPRAPLGQVRCGRNGCRNAHPGWVELCSECQSRGKREGHRSHAHEEAAATKQRCRTVCCDHYANQEKHGYCNECAHFMQIYRG
ncbi:tumor necrosis factor alpha-induced protein 3 [Scleropages formosus]|uniref:ubiquitinyl hydrolase 1 n=1 Tax=Scleropages formosus TaxID=113540 RepID=A0A8D0CGA5_SCLFO|nr:tumor necrosis factor alpha-induced protein 3 [Scleropages formosus]